MIPALIVLAAGVASAGAYVLWCYREETRPDRIPVLLYHRLLSKARFESGAIQSDERSYVCFDSDFAAEMQVLHDQGYRTLDLDDFLRIRRGEMHRPDKPIMVTFDDGFRSVFL